MKKLLSAKVEVGVGSLPFHLLRVMALVLAIITLPFAFVFFKAVGFIAHAHVLAVLQSLAEEIEKAPVAKH